jgi:hypothetical protein
MGGPGEVHVYRDKFDLLTLTQSVLAINHGATGNI